MPSFGLTAVAIASIAGGGLAGYNHDKWEVNLTTNPRDIFNIDLPGPGPAGPESSTTDTTVPEQIPDVNPLPIGDLAQIKVELIRLAEEDPWCSETRVLLVKDADILVQDQQGGEQARSGVSQPAGGGADLPPPNTVGEGLEQVEGYSYVKPCFDPESIELVPADDDRPPYMKIGYMTSPPTLTGEGHVSLYETYRAGGLIGACIEMREGIKEDAMRDVALVIGAEAASTFEIQASFAEEIIDERGIPDRPHHPCNDFFVIPAKSDLAPDAPVASLPAPATQAESAPETTTPSPTTTTSPSTSAAPAPEATSPPATTESPYSDVDFGTSRNDIDLGYAIAILPGDNSPIVERMQQQLEEINCYIGPDGADGIYGDDTKLGVQGFERNIGEEFIDGPIDGVLDRLTFAYLDYSVEIGNRACGGQIDWASVPGADIAAATRTPYTPAP